jgi:KRAB domain-containing zinc finger protein
LGVDHFVEQKYFCIESFKMSEMKKIKIEPVCDDFDRVESVECIENKIKQEPEVQFVLILPPRQVKIEIIEEEVLKESKAQSEKKKFQCQNCPRSFENLRSLFSHERSHQQKVKCGICNNDFRKYYLKDHLKRHQSIRKFNCDHCSSSYVTKAGLVCHMWKHRSDKQFKCTQCNRGYNQIGAFKIHLLSHTNNPRPFQCDLCPKNYATKLEVKVHLMAIHTELSFKCDQCDYMTKWKTNLNQHKKRHLSLKPFSCQTCEKKFKTKFEVQQHQSVHKETNDFECKTCGKMFGTRNNLRIHERSVHGEKF